MRRNTLGVWLVFMCCAATAVAALQTWEIPNPRPRNWVADTLCVMRPADIEEINRLGDAVRATAPSSGLFVVTVGSTAGANHRDFATALLNQWGPDGSLRSGVLVFVALEDRKAELVLGDNLLTPAGRAKSDAIMRDVIVARLKQGDECGALVGAAQACAEEFFGVPSVSHRPPTAAPGVTSRSAESAVLVSLPSVAVELPLERTGPAQAPAPVAAPTQRPPPRTAPSGNGVVALLFLLVGVGVVVAIVIVNSGPKKCPKCEREMQQLGPEEEKPHLSASERTEERVGSVDYQLWLCPGCATVEKVRKGRWFSGYSDCPQCQAVTRHDVSRTISAATVHSTGLAEITEHCVNCGYHRVTTRILARLPAPQSSGNRTFGSSGRSSGSGRSSSGGGSSGSW